MILKIRYIILFIFSIVFLSSCGSAKKSVVNNSNSKEISKKTKELFNESDLVYNKFTQKHGNNLNPLTLSYVKRYKDVAIEDMEIYKIPASITLAQGILESGSGKSNLALKSNNHFGIKCHKDWNGKKVRHDDDRRRECFRKYKHPEESFDDHSQFLTRRGRYSTLFLLREDDYKAWAKGLKKAGYATDRKYPQKLITIIEEYRLYEYDDMVLGKYKKSLSKRNKLKSKSKKHLIASNTKTNYIVVNKGDTLYSIARNNRVSVAKIKKINGLTSNDISIGQKLFLTK